MDNGHPIGSTPAPDACEVENICGRALEGRPPTRNEIVALLEVEPGTEQSRTVNAACAEIARRANGGFGYIFAQIGLDADPCPGNCAFCDFAACNRKDGGRSEETPIDMVLHCCELFSENGVNLISLMTSAACSWERYLDIVAQVRAAVGNEVAIMANTRDFTREEGEELADAGADCVYHAVRLGEGRLTDLDEARRWQTIAHAQAAGLGVSSGVGPIYRSPLGESPYRQTKEDIADRMLELARRSLVCGGASGLHAIPGTKMEHIEPFPREKVAIVASIFQLVLGQTTCHGGGGSVHWVDAGLDPRSRDYESDDASLAARIEKWRGQLAADGWTQGTKLRTRIREAAGKAAS